jgi:Arc/MetJ family transcription regulator
MRTNIELDDDLIEKAMLATGTSTKRAAVDAALRLAVRLHAQEGIRKYFGKVQWEGDLEQSRLSRFEPTEE